MLRAALTGGIATGKSYCLGRFVALGAIAIDADRLSRDAVAPGTPGLEAVAARFGSEILQPDGTLNRPALGRMVFADPKARAALEAIIHPEVYRRIGEWLANLPPGTRLAVADIPLLYESGHTHDFDAVVVCACVPEEQVRRIVARDALTPAEARARLTAQWPIDEKVKRASHVIWTDRGFTETDAQIAEVYRELVVGQ